MSKKKEKDIILVIDLEATCWEGDAPEGMVSEIIEIGISAVDYYTKEIRLRDTLIIKPEHSTISEFCTKLTSLTPEYVEKHGISFSEACLVLKQKFLSKDRAWMSWGEYDRNQFARDCKLKNVKNPMGRTHTNAKALFSFAYGLPKELSVEKALDHLGMEFNGTAHRGIDDAENIAKIINKIFVPLIDEKTYGKKIRKEHQVLDDYLQEKYKEGLLDENVARIVNKNTPQNPDKSMR